MSFIPSANVVGIFMKSLIPNKVSTGSKEQYVKRSVRNLTKKELFDIQYSNVVVPINSLDKVVWYEKLSNSFTLSLTDGKILT